MLPKKNRADTKILEEVFKTGKILSSPLFTLKFILKTPSNNTQISFVVPKHIAKRAIERNRLRRLGYRAMEKHLDSPPRGFAGAFIYKKYEDDMEKIEYEVKNILSKIH